MGGFFVEGGLTGIIEDCFCPMFAVRFYLLVGCWFLSDRNLGVCYTDMFSMVVGTGQGDRDARDDGGCCLVTSAVGLIRRCVTSA